MCLTYKVLNTPQLIKTGVLHTKKQNPIIAEIPSYMCVCIYIYIYKTKLRYSTLSTVP